MLNVHLFVCPCATTQSIYLLPNPDKPEIGNIKIENLKVKLRRLYNAMISQKNWLASHFTFSFFIFHFDI
jgi:hypothetical protein